jgi:Cys-rich repeat protein
MKTLLKLFATMLGIVPLGLLFIILAGNTASNCGETEPEEAVCASASDCEGLPHLECVGGWTCADKQCLWVCDQVETSCMTTGDCPEGQHCTTEDGACLKDVVCKAGEDGAEKCFAACLGVCEENEEPPEFCTSDEDCADGFVCQFSKDVVLPCTEDSGDGFAAQKCLGQPAGTCVPEDPVTECTSDADCAPGEYCEFSLWMDPCGGKQPEYEGAGDAAPCFQSGICQPKPDPAECMSDEDCAPGEFCDFNQYVSSPCAEEKWDCASEDCGMACIPMGVCMPQTQPSECFVDSDCPEGMVCQNDVLCWEEEACDCGPDTDCVCAGLCEAYGICVPKPIPGECETDADCPPDMVCAMALSCADVECICAEGSDEPCECGSLCGGYGECVPAPQPQCFSDFDCSKKEWCINGVCVWKEDPIYCASDLECPAGFFCQFDGDSWCGFEGDGEGENDQATEWCMGVCAQLPPCGEIDCADGFELDPMTCECVNVTNVCQVSGCSGEICSEEPVASYCIWEPWYVCLGPEITTCGPFGPDGGCMWQPTAAFFDCMSQFWK